MASTPSDPANADLNAAAGPNHPAAPHADSRTTPDFETIESALDGFFAETPDQQAASRSGRPEGAGLAVATVMPLAANRPPRTGLEPRQAIPEELVPASRMPSPLFARQGLQQMFAPLGDRRRWMIVLGIVGVAAVTIPLATYVYRESAQGAASTAGGAGLALGTATFESNPSGLPVVVDGRLQGMTPLKLTLPVGAHQVDIGAGTTRRQLSAAVAADTLASYYVELTAGAGGLGGAAGSDVGDLEVVSDPVGAQVSVDGVARGITPLVLNGIPAGEHEVRLMRDGTTINRSVRVTAGAGASVFASTVGASAAGWVTIDAPFEMKVSEGGALLGTTASSRIMLRSGAHTLDLVNDDLEFTTRMSVRVLPDKTITARVPVPTGLLSINAVPWADVLVDGQAVGTTPLGNLAVPIGSREVVWRHPQFGERRRQVTIKQHAPVRIGVDFTQ
jgi:hypothetical protein